MKIFINYKRNLVPDQPVAEFLQQAFKDAGHDVFRDATGIQSGAEWAPVIRQHLDEARVVVSLVSNASLRSTWVLNEIDRARRLGKLLIPILLEKLDDSLEFQEYMPRFMQVQHYPYHGNMEEAALDLCERLKNNPAVYESEWYAFTDPNVPDDSENPGWKDFFAASPQLAVDGKYRLALTDAVRLAIFRSAYYQRHQQGTAEANPASPKADPMDGLAFQAFRQGFFTQIAIGEFGTCGFVRPASSTQAPSSGQVDGYLGLLLRGEKARCLKDIRAAQERKLAFLNARFEAGVITVLAIQEHHQTMAARHSELQQAGEELEDALDRFRIYQLGLPDHTGLEVEDSLCRPLPFTDPEFMSVQEHIGEIERQLWLPELSDQQLAELEPDIAKAQQTVASFFPPVRRELEQLRAHVADERWIHMSATDREEKKSTRAELQGRLETLERQLFETRDFDNRALYSSLKSGTPYDDTPRFQQEEKARQQARCAAETLDQLDVVQMQVRLAALEAKPIDLDLEKALELAQRHRPDRQLLETNIGLRRAVRLNLRHVLRDLERGRKRLQQVRQATANILDLWYLALLLTAAGKETADYPIPASIDYFESRYRLCEAWVQYQAARMRLYRETGVMHIDSEGIWLDQPIPV